MKLNVFALALFVSGLCSLLVAEYARRRRTASGKPVFVLLMAASAVWSIAYGFELASTGLAAMIVFTRIEYLGIATVPVLWLLLILHHTGRERWLAPRRVALLFVIPLVTFCMVYTNEMHHLFYRSTGFDLSGPFPMQALTVGPWYWVHITYSYLVLMTGLVLLWNQSVHAARTYRWQAWILWTGASLPWAVNVSYILGFRAFAHMDATPIAFTVSGVILAWGMFHFRLFDLTPIARGRVIEGMSDAVLIFDARYRLVDSNPRALSLIGPNAGAVGRYIWETLVDWPELVELSESGEINAVEITREIQGDPRFFAASVSLLSTHWGKTVGRVLTIHDLTELRRTQTQLEISRESLKEAVSRLQIQNRELRGALTRIKRLEGLLPICSYCKKIRDDQNYWREVEHYIGARTDAKFSHGICPDCMVKYVEPKLKEMRKKNK
jgi:PAS domain S-box-containing protein